MLKEIIETGKTIDEAIESACLKLGCQRDQCEWEILDLPKKVFFGLKSIPAKVKVTIEVPDEKPAKPQAPTVQQKPYQPKRENLASKPQEPKQRKAATPAPAKETKTEKQPPAAMSAEVQKKADLAAGYMRSILDAMKLEATVEASYEQGGILVKIEGKGLGVMIGRRGETLDAVQYLTGLVVNRLDGDYLRVTIDCGDYRMKRQKTLESLAKRLSAQVLKTNVSKTLEPMNPFERRIIHATVSEIEGVSSTSIGEEPNRRVVITTPTARKPAPGREPARPSGGKRGPERNGRPDRRGGYRGERRPSAPRPKVDATGPPKQTFEQSIDGNPLYTKIDLE